MPSEFVLAIPEYFVRNFPFHLAIQILFGVLVPHFGLLFGTWHPAIWRPEAARLLSCFMPKLLLRDRTGIMSYQSLLVLQLLMKKLKQILDLKKVLNFAICLLQEP